MDRAGRWLFVVHLVIFLAFSGAGVARGEGERSGEPRRFASDLDFAREVVDRAGGRVRSPGTLAGEVLALSEEGRWAFGTRDDQVPVAWSLDGSGLSLEPPGEHIHSGAVGVIGVAPGGQWLMWGTTSSRHPPVTRFYQIGPEGRTLVPFHAIEGKILKIEKVRSDGSLVFVRSLRMMSGDRGVEPGTRLLEIDARAGRVEMLELDLGAVPEMGEVDLDRMLVLDLDTDLVAPFTLEKSGTGAILRPGAPEDRKGSTHSSSDGRWKYVIRNEDHDRRLERPAQPDPFVLSLGPRIRWAQFTPDSRWFLCGDMDLVLRAWDLDLLGTGNTSPTFERYIPGHMGSPPWEAPPRVRIRSDRQLALARPGSSRVELFSLDDQLGSSFVVEDTPVSWGRLVSRPGGWPTLETRARLDHDTGILTVSVENTGISTAHLVQVTLNATPTMGAGLDPLHVGDIAPSEVRVRTRRVDLGSWTTPVRCRVQAQGVDVRSGTGTLLVLPRWIRDEAHYHEVARAVFEEGVAILREILKKPDYSPRLTPTEEFGFRAGGGETVYYQVPSQLDAHGVMVNRNVMSVTSQEEFDRHAQMFLLWFIPHELIHTLGTPTTGSWRFEREANLLQPLLTARILERLGSRTPFTPESMAWVYERYVEALRPHAPDGVEASLQRFAVDPAAPVPYPGDATEYFLQNTTEYVHFIAYLDRYSWNRGADLETLVRGAMKGENCAP